MANLDFSLSPLYADENAGLQGYIPIIRTCKFVSLALSFTHLSHLPQLKQDELVENR